MNKRERPALAQRGITGLETAIILIAFVVVASVFAFTVLSAGVQSSEANKQTVAAGLSEARTLLLQQGSAFAYQGDVGGTGAVYKVAFLVANSLAGEPIDMTPPYTADDSGIDPDYVSNNTSVTVVSYADEHQRLLDVPWTVQFVGKNNGDYLLEEGEKAEVTVWLLDRDTSKAITETDSVAYMDGTADGGGTGGIDSTGTLLVKSTRFMIELAPQDGAPLTIQRTIPPGLRQVMNLR
ncbi:MAG: hypothetical protein FJ313_01415 [Gemmatimonadetes bacterium]|nr:hypothetical protein [Gemmatimonadota bacterium]